MGINQHHIYIISDKEIRAEMIRQLLRNIKSRTKSISTLNTNQLDGLDKNYDTELFIVDLSSVDKPSGLIIKMVKSLRPDSKIIVLHIYRSSKLINPLYEMGINGYLHIEPEKEEFESAITTVVNGSLYKPNFMQNA
jgi:DNA-binding NarL/FixJ family response regulator